MDQLTQDLPGVALSLPRRHPRQRQQCRGTFYEAPTPVPVSARQRTLLPTRELFPGSTLRRVPRSLSVHGWCRKRSESRHNLRSFLGKFLPWQWGAPEHAAFQQIKDLLSADTVLAHFNPALERAYPATHQMWESAVPCSTDTAMVVRDPSLMHQKTLTQTQRKYSQMQKETGYHLWSQPVSPIPVRKTFCPSDSSQATNRLIWTDKTHSSSGSEQTCQMGSYLEPI
ncbi:integrase domain containing protein [Plakobranchus ocellatus]|uniref:Integrase domain containing protein n=1 Tax=Plakobranchus ocellatus TaxID=259542 RepID=A0AAV4CKV1_9GAST|nr:integrase domain containing protein [Plakobranchus ocellatus]